ncbi:P2X purinoceptor 7-like [Pimephales promelas]|uniref:P2X purinoceptor 7-like n=1 Tax=Pimephales promelas TaxID=90988 RepID=UPI001955F122|nr:P2X purinoceptor 7-like [Pimephales promelas]
MHDLQAQRIDFEDTLIGRLSLQQSHQMLRDILHHDPSLVFDLRLRTSEGVPPVPPSTAAAPSWCVCARCREMPTDLERKCCGFRPAECISSMPHMEIFILMEGHLRMARRLWNDIRAVEDAQSPGESNRQFRHAAYRQWVVWQYGSLGSGRRVVIPSCCVWAIRDRFPDPNGHYVGFIVSRF